MPGAAGQHEAPESAELAIGPEDEERSSAHACPDLAQTVCWCGGDGRAFVAHLVSLEVQGLSMPAGQACSSLYIAYDRAGFGCATGGCSNGEPFAIPLLDVF